MALYLIGDLQGCDSALGRLLDKIGFSPSRDTLFLLGDLVNRGPESLGVLRRLSGLGDAAQCLLGNHDLHALAVWQGVRSAKKSDTLGELLAAPDCGDLMQWLRHRPLAIAAHGWLMVHAGVQPQWTLSSTLALAGEVQNRLQSLDFMEFLRDLFGNLPARWQGDLAGIERARVIVNALTRLRFCTADGTMELSSNASADDAPEGFFPWFAAPGRLTQAQPIAFGHWSTLDASPARNARLRHNTLGLDTGCVWGGCLSAAKLGANAPEFELIQVECEQAQSPL